MTDPDLPEDLAALEHSLAGRPRPRPSAALRKRVLAAVAAEERAGGRMGRWEFALAVAAAVILWVNLSRSAANRMDGTAEGLPRNGLDSAVATVQELVPEFTEAEARGCVWRLRAGSRLVQAPAPEPAASFARRATLLTVSS